MSTRGGNDKKRGPKYQNSFGYVHNRNSKRTKVIEAMPNEGCCQRCFDKIEWRKKYRKYKPLTQQSTWYVYFGSQPKILMRLIFLPLIQQPILQAKMRD
jgi:hypothetical protein